MDEPKWLTLQDVEFLHARQLRRFGGLAGLRDLNAVESALARPQQKWIYEPESDLATLAAAYGYGLARNHGFVDGNKRVALAALATFVRINGQRLVAPEVEAVTVMLGVAAGELDEAALAVWIRQSVEPRS